MSNKWVIWRDSRYVHIHADSWSSSFRVHDGDSGDIIDQGGRTPAVQRPSPVGVFLFYPHLTHHLTWARRQDVHLSKNITFAVWYSETMRTLFTKLLCHLCKQTWDDMECFGFFLPYSGLCRSLDSLPMFSIFLLKHLTTLNPFSRLAKLSNVKVEFTSYRKLLRSINHPGETLC